MICVRLPLNDDIIIAPSILVDSVDVAVVKDKAKVKRFLFNIGRTTYVCMSKYLLLVQKTSVEKNPAKKKIFNITQLAFVYHKYLA